ncbi:MAG: stage II sporulation protein M [Balneolaceae bacterium]|nr:stage II sporulation protein M [Balneolaceae bacterium]
MREVTFLRNNASKWKEFEELIQKKKKADPDKLADYYIELTNDLSYAQTFYPDSQTTQYLNKLTQQVHETLYRNRKEEKSRILTFWMEELPLLFADHQKELLYSFIVFLIAIGIGVISAANDSTFTRLILGDQYVNMTLHNIEQNDPMAVYKQSRSLDMFLGITFNNVRVSFFAFVFGLLTSFGTGAILLRNGIMIGAFFHLFFEHSLLGEALKVVFIHGTLELSAIVIAGGAGIVMGNSMLFPGTYSRRESFKMGVRKGAKMVIGLVPIFILAGFLEGYVTRLTGMPLAASLAIILGSLAFILYYFVALPLYTKNKRTHE